MTPARSVLLPARNARRFVGEALASLRRQTFGNLEIVAVDDASSDGTGELLRQAAGEDGRIRVVNGPGRGICAALNAGLEACRAPVVALRAAARGARRRSDAGSGRLPSGDLPEGGDDRRAQGL
jgi:glycosyltransferase involved in cell wall biosynthesis